MKTCPVCGRQFKTHGYMNFLQKYCSAECREQAKVKRQQNDKSNRKRNFPMAHMKKFATLSPNQIATLKALNGGNS